MRSLASFTLEPEAALDLLAALDAAAGTDAFLTPGRDGRAPRILAGLKAEAELVADAATGPRDMAAFAFADARPVLGWLAYEWGLARHGVTSAKTRSLPLGALRKYALYLSYDPDARSLELLHPSAAGPAGEEGGTGPADDLVDLVRDLLAEGPPKALTRAPVRFSGALAQSLDRTAYENAVQRAVDHIRASDVSELNLSMELRAEITSGDPLGLLRLLFRRYPAGYYACFRAPGGEREGGGAQTLLSTSPERFLRVKDGEVLTQPIKGTLHAGLDRAPRELAETLLASDKDEAELAIAVDLARDDLAAVCGTGSVRVYGHKSVLQVDDLLHMYSNVTGTLREECDVFDLLAAAFPPASVCGNPRRRSLQIIEELEPHSREAYGGSFLMIHGPRDMDASTAVRTARCGAKSLVFHAGSAVVAESEPSREYHETMAKAGKFLNLLRELA
ncbi:Chorismate binding domain-containing protein [Desulfovibrio sp. X2]|uniref:chorismate-binding protein n=1 Tax=Desulfovibrio sp. X2 TaxID=941449 RepID=UPI0003587E36|nr:chorismate-binding protein [Desulfovibrio sp. X2]EPR43994.1 Chorismate binding domain-containing protein [Desulfovibrio sp. X2]